MIPKVVLWILQTIGHIHAGSHMPHPHELEKIHTLPHPHTHTQPLIWAIVLCSQDQIEVKGSKYQIFFSVSLDWKQFWLNSFCRVATLTTLHHRKGHHEYIGMIYIDCLSCGHASFFYRKMNNRVSCVELSMLVFFSSKASLPDVVITTEVERNLGIKMADFTNKDEANH